MSTTSSPCLGTPLAPAPAAGLALGAKGLGGRGTYAIQKIRKRGDARFGQREVEAVAGTALGKKHKLLRIRKSPPSNAQLLPRCSADQPCQAGRSLCRFTPHIGLPQPCSKQHSMPRFSVTLLPSSLSLRKECALAYLN